MIGIEPMICELTARCHTTWLHTLEIGEHKNSPEMFCLSRMSDRIPVIREFVMVTISTSVLCEQHFTCPKFYPLPYYMTATYNILDIGFYQYVLQNDIGCTLITVFNPDLGASPHLLW